MQNATWIWFPGDFEIWQHMLVSFRREEYGMVYPPFWRIDSYSSSVEFRKDFKLENEETINVYADGRFRILLDNNILKGKDKFLIPAGEHNLTILVANETCLPSLFVEGNTIKSDDTWEVSNHDKTWTKPGFWNFNTPDNTPSKFKLATTEIHPVGSKQLPTGILYDFGKETFASINLNDFSGDGKITIYYGESIEEATTPEHCILSDEFDVNEKNFLGIPKAFRYVQLVFDGNVQAGNVSAFYEYLPLEYKGYFECSDEEINKIWETAVYTFHLNSREFFLDGIKRDRWVWAGDAYQSFLLNYYIFFDEPLNKRTLYALRGKDPVVYHINTILDYTFYWFMGVYEHYLYTGDVEFVKSIFPRMVTLMDFCLSRRNENNMVEGVNGDWVFVDWADDMEKDGELCAEQILFYKSLEAMASCCKLVGENSTKYADLADELKGKIIETFWDKEKGALVTTRMNNILSKQITRHPNIFAGLFDMLTPEQLKSVKQNVILNDEVTKIKTPYFRFYELAMLCKIGEIETVTKELKDYWGGMLKLGATTFWEEYDPRLQGAEHYEMYGFKFGKSLCHAWGASPIYLLGRYYLGVRPLTPGYETYEIASDLGGLEWMKGTVPAPNGGKIEIEFSQSRIRILSNTGTGYLKLKNGLEQVIEKDKEYIIEL